MNLQFKSNNNNNKAPKHGRASEMENYIPKHSSFEHFSNVNVVSCLEITKCTEYI